MGANKEEFHRMMIARDRAANTIHFYVQSASLSVCGRSWSTGEG